MLLPLPRATASVELVGLRSISSVAAAAEHHAAVLEKQRTGSGWGGGEEMWRTAREASALAGDVEEGKEMVGSTRLRCAQRRRRTQEDGQGKSNLGLGSVGSWFCLSGSLTGRLSKLGPGKKFKLGQIIRPIGPYIGP